jgi:hypothetical protein
MSISFPSLAQLDPQQVEQFRQLLGAFLSAAWPQLDLKRGPLHDLLLLPAAAISAAWQTQIQQWLQSSSLAQVAANPALADPTTVANLLSNYGLTLSPGQAAQGTVLVLFSQPYPVSIGTQTVFTINGQTFQPSAPVNGRPPGTTLLGPNDVVLQAVGNYWALSVSVTATQVGQAGNVAGGMTASLSPQPPNLVTAYTAAAFQGGQDPTSLSQLVPMALGGMANKTWSTRATITALLASLIPTFQAASIIGFGDPEMQRDQRSVWPGHLGGRVDIWAQTAPMFQVQYIPVTGTLVSVSGTVGTWQINIGRDQAPGFYEVVEILGNGQVPGNGYPPLQDQRGMDLTPQPGLLLPDIQSPTEATYSRFQTASIQFQDLQTNAKNLPIGSTQPYQIGVQLLPGIATLQDTLGQDTLRPLSSDVLVRAAVPCFVSVSFTLQGTSLPTSFQPLAQALQTAVGQLGFAGSLSASYLAQVIHNVLGPNVIVTNFLLSARLRRVDGQVLTWSDPQLLTIPDDPLHAVTANTVVFWLPSQNVQVVLQ